MVYLFSFLMSVTGTLLMLGLTFRAVDAGASPMELGLLGGSFALPYCVLCFLLARRFASVDARLSSLGSSISVIVLCFLGRVVTTVPLFMLLGLMSGASSAFFWPPLEHHMGRGQTADSLYRVLGRFNFWWCGGTAIATAVCGSLYHWDFRLPFLAGAACLLPVVACSRFLTSRNSLDCPPASSPKPDARAPAFLQKRFFLTTARIFIFLTYASTGAIFALFPKLGDRLDLSKPVVSRTLFFLPLAQLLSFYMLGKTRRWQNNVSFLLAGQVLIATAFAAVFLSNRTALFACAFAAVGLVSGLSYFSSLFYTLHEPVFRSSLAGVHEALLSSGAVSGRIFFGAIAGVFNLKFPYLLVACIFSLFGLYTFLERKRLNQ